MIYDPKILNRYKVILIESRITRELRANTTTETFQKVWLDLLRSNIFSFPGKLHDE